MTEHRTRAGRGHSTANWKLPAPIGVAAVMLVLAASALAQDVRSPQLAPPPPIPPQSIPSQSVPPQSTPSPSIPSQPAAPEAAQLPAAPPQSDQSQPPPPESILPAPSFQPGFIDALGRWLEEGSAKLKSDMQGAQDNLDKFGKEARDAAKDATGNLISLPNPRVVIARERCTPAQNGAPDCVSAANTMCRGKGFQTGRSLDTQTEQKCPPRLLLSGRSPNDVDCATEYYVTRAVCQ